ncbi:MAG: RCC1 domain-containing protein [Polyangiaceae bacterium]
MTKGWGALALVCVSCGGLTSESSDEPTHAQGAELALAAGLASTCAVKAGEVECWGHLDYSLENFDAPVQATPRELEIPGEVTAVHAGGYHWCAQTADHSVWCWGMNNQGQVDGGFSDFEQPSRMKSLDGRVAAVDAGEFNSCALTLDGEVYCWGFAGHGLRPGGDHVAFGEPELIPGFGERVIQIDVGYRRACALTESHAVKCWGNEALEDYSYDDPHPFEIVQLPSLESGVERILPMRDRLMCALMQDHTVRCSGIKFLFEVVPSQVVEIPGATDIVDGGAGYDFACFVNGAGKVACFGRADYGQLGAALPDTEFSEEFHFPQIDGVKQISVGGAHVCVENAEGAYCWGANEFAQLGKLGSKFEWQPQALEL